MGQLIPYIKAAVPLDKYTIHIYSSRLADNSQKLFSTNWARWVEFYKY